MPLSPIPEIIAELKAGRMVVLVDEEDRENEGDLVLAADFVTPEAINFMARYGRGLICLTLTEERCRQLRLPPMVQQNRAAHGTAFTVSIEAAEGVSTGISAADRARTIQAAVARNAQAEDIVQPGHIFPLTAQNGGVLMRAGHTEAGCDLAAAAGLTPAAVICEILKDDGSMARLPDLVEFAREHGLKVGAIADLIHHRSRHENLVERAGERTLQTAQGEFQIYIYREKLSGATHLALVKGEPQPDRETLVRVHEPVSVVDCLDWDLPSHAWSVPAALATIAAASAGVLVLLHRPESAEELAIRALGHAKPVASKSQLRDYGIGAQILRDLKVGKMRLMSRPRKMPSMAGFDLEVTGYLERPGVTRS
ncbi:MAG: 3,4-dihydroxy-2-butanone-4-phosphate synthase [Betaproteobacteria bacterium]|nr:3,4-dihydroxy-2-butanone-4-phosphate synthase [Betaproteobacteria bacterium]